MAYFAARQAQTTLSCPHCGQALLVERSCREAHMYCAACRRRFDLKPFIAQADEALETFLEGLYLDRI
ncbi:dual CXXC motif small (seleno)protein [uncultured Desulfovibrio sp.]|uniref:dual CXXC motif small (seleno)protein n=1 Tax=uncultured Desulfovibrio sp. TaxID=167968 RepID=UPI0025D8FAE1|nr:dual CXXC motif small (seleno)protein [uncultured Desulfovibrio sp.]